MELTPVGTDFVMIVVGKTYPIREHLKALGFRWNKPNKVWYHLGDFTKAQCEFLEIEVNNPEWPGLSYRLCSFDNPISLLA